MVMFHGPLSGKLCATGLRAGDTNPEHTVMSLFLSTSIYLRCHNRLQMSHLGALDQQWDWAPEVRLSSELIWAHYFEKIQWGGCGCCWDSGMITAQMSLHFFTSSPLLFSRVRWRLISLRQDMELDTKSSFVFLLGTSFCLRSHWTVH